MIQCTWHEVCAGGFVQGPNDVDTILRCMVARGALVTVDGRYITSRTKRSRLTVVRKS